jgi:hypothetical protein
MEKILLPNYLKFPRYGWHGFRGETTQHGSNLINTLISIDCTNDFMSCRNRASVYAKVPWEGLTLPGDLEIIKAVTLWAVSSIGRASDS